MSDYQCLDCFDLNRDREEKNLLCVRCEIRAKSKPKAQAKTKKKVASHGLARKDLLAADAYQPGQD